MKRPRKGTAKRDIVHQDSDEHFAYIAGYTFGGCPYGITWKEMREIERDEAQANLAPAAPLEFSPESVTRFFARHGISVEARLKNGGISVHTLSDHTPLVRYVPVGKKGEMVEVLWWSHRERWEEIGDFGGIEMPLPEALQYVIDGEPGFSIF